MKSWALFEMTNLESRGYPFRMHKITKEHSLIVTKLAKIQTKCQGPGPGFEPGSWDPQSHSLDQTSLSRTQVFFLFHCL